MLMKWNKKQLTIKFHANKETFTDEEDYVYSLMGWLVANADDDLTKKYLDHKNRRFFKHSLTKIRDHLEVTGWYKYSGKYFTSELGWPENFESGKWKGQEDVHEVE